MDKTKLLELLKEFSDHGISLEAKRLQPVLDFQDIIGRSSFDETIETYLELNETQKELFDFACLHCLDRAFNRELMRKLYVKDVQNSFQNINNIRIKYESDINAHLYNANNYQLEIKRLKIDNNKLRNDLSNFKNILNKY